MVSRRPHRVSRTYLTRPTVFKNYRKGFRVYKVGITAQTELSMNKYFEKRGYGTGSKVLFTREHPDLDIKGIETQIEKQLLAKLKSSFSLVPRKKEHFLVPNSRRREFKKMAKKLM
jgi:hypothetical protein